MVYFTNKKSFFHSDGAGLEGRAWRDVRRH